MFFTPPAVAPPTFTPATPATAPVQVSTANPAPYGWQSYTVRAGDSVYAIAARQRTTVATIVVRNKLPNHGRTIHAGQSLMVPRTAPAKATSTAAATTKSTAATTTTKTTYVVRAGDTLSSIATRHNTTMDRIAQLSGLRSKMVIHPGQKLIVATSTTSAGKPATAAAKKAPARSTTSVKVKSGDTLWQLAQRYKTTVAAITKANKLSGSRIHVGQTLAIPSAVSTSAATANSSNTFAGRTYPDATVSAAQSNRNTLASAATPSRTQVKNMIIETARRNGVDPQLALAIGWQESGWDQKQVSVANAIGVMQVIPDSGKWASSMVGRTLNLHNTQDNITAGVVILRALHKMADNSDHAIAGYYQGLGSVQKNGMYSDTKQYVANIKALRGRL